MKNTRRYFLKSGMLAGLGTSLVSWTYPEKQIKDATLLQGRYAPLDAAMEEPVLKTEYFPEPVIIASCDLLEYDGNYICRVRSTKGAEGYCVGHNHRMPHLFPMQVQQVNPFFVGKDARDLDSLIEEGIMMYQNNYKYQGYALWIPIATAEMAILDMLGRIAGKSMGELIGRIHNTEIAIYQTIGSGVEIDPDFIAKHKLITL